MNSNVWEGDFPSVRLIRLLQERGGGLLVVPPKGEHHFESFPLPRLPTTDVHWAADFAARFWRARRRCVSAALMLDVMTRRWMPVVPTQNCARGGARWSCRPADFAGLPAHVRLAGSYQSHPAPGPFAAAAAVPPFDGIHVIEQPPYRRRPRLAYTFLRYRGEAALAEPAAVLANDVAAALSRFALRLRIV
jgi:hypothetical protein